MNSNSTITSSISRILFKRLIDYFTAISFNQMDLKMRKYANKLITKETQMRSV